MSELAFIEQFGDVDAAIKNLLRVNAEYARGAHGATRAMVDVAVKSLQTEVRAALNAGPQDGLVSGAADELRADAERWEEVNRREASMRARMAERCSQEGAGSAGGLASRPLPTEAMYSIKEVARLMAWEKWGREHAKPALEYTERHGGIGAETRSNRALASMPTDAKGE